MPISSNNVRTLTNIRIRRASFSGAPAFRAPHLVSWCKSYEIPYLPKTVGVVPLAETRTMSLPFSLPLLDQEVVDEVVDAITNTGWITSGPKVKLFEQAIGEYVGCEHTAAVSSWTTGAMVMLRWYGVGPGDEVIVPSYTYAATALAVLNVGATPVMVDVEAPFHISLTGIANAITEKTKAIIPVDLGGWPCDYVALEQLLASEGVQEKFKSANTRQETLGRPLVIGDAAHSLGAKLDGTKIGGSGADVTIFSFHSVKNLTTGEGGMICLNLPPQFDVTEETRRVKYLSLNGQTKTALDKSTVGGWRYDIVDQGFKANMPDLCAAVGLAQIRRYESQMLPERRQIFDAYNAAFADKSWALLPSMSDERHESSLHLYQLRIDGISEQQRNDMMHHIAEERIGVNVHYVPLPMLTLFQRLGYDMANHPNAFDLYQNEITLPVYNGLSLDDVSRVADAVIKAKQAV